jgi:hypothetical protein
MQINQKNQVNYLTNYLGPLLQGRGFDSPARD